MRAVGAEEPGQSTARNPARALEELLPETRRWRVGLRAQGRATIGFGAKPLIALRWLLPDRAFDALIRLATGTPRR